MTEQGADPLLLLLIFVGTIVVFLGVVFVSWITVEYVRHRRDVKFCKANGYSWFPFDWTHLL